MLKVKVEGYAEAKRILDELPNTMQKSMLLAALRTSARPMLQTAKTEFRCVAAGCASNYASYVSRTDQPPSQK